MNEALNEAFRHSAWATKTLIVACRNLSVEQLTEPAPGFGSILGTLNHFVLSDAGYVAILTGVRPEWATDGNESQDFDEIEARVDETAHLWEQLLAEPFDAERLLILEEGAYECTAGVVIAQSLHHASVHREQICACITGIGIQPPDVQPWAYADATGRARWRSPEN